VKLAVIHKTEMKYVKLIEVKIKMFPNPNAGRQKYENARFSVHWMWQLERGRRTRAPRKLRR
jgi:hypothetical protein